MSSKPDRPDGFTLIEALIALVVASILSIGLVRFFGATQQITRHADDRLLIATLIAQLDGSLPPADKLESFDRSGKRGDLTWRMSGRAIEREPEEPKSAALADPVMGDAVMGDAASEPAAEQPQSLWQRYAISIEIRRNDAVLDRAQTIRLGKAPKPPSDAEGAP